MVRERMNSRPAVVSIGRWETDFKNRRIGRSVGRCRPQLQVQRGYYCCSEVTCWAGLSPGSTERDHPMTVQEKQAYGRTDIHTRAAPGLCRAYFSRAGVAPAWVYCISEARREFLGQARGVLFPYITTAVGTRPKDAQRRW